MKGPVTAITGALCGLLLDIGFPAIAQLPEQGVQTLSSKPTRGCFMSGPVVAIIGALCGLLLDVVFSAATQVIEQGLGVIDTGRLLLHGWLCCCDHWGALQFPA